MVSSDMNGQSTMKILLKDVLYAPKMGLTLISIGKIDMAGFTLFQDGSLKVFTKEKKKLVDIPLKNGLYHLEHEVELAAVVDEEVVTVRGQQASWTSRQ